MTAPTIYVAGDRARYTGLAFTDGECLCPGDEVVVIEPNEDYEDDAIVRFRGAYIAVSAPLLTWLESGAV